MNSTEDNTGAAAAPAPTLDGIHAGVFELISLLEVLEELSGDITFRKPDDKDKQNIARVQNLANIAVHYARVVETRVDDFNNFTFGASA